MRKSKEFVIAWMNALYHRQGLLDNLILLVVPLAVSTFIAQLILVLFPTEISLLLVLGVLLWAGMLGIGYLIEALDNAAVQISNDQRRLEENYDRSEPALALLENLKYGGVGLIFLLKSDWLVSIDGQFVSVGGGCFSMDEAAALVIQVMSPEGTICEVAINPSPYQILYFQMVDGKLRAGLTPKVEDLD